ncbi:MAG: hypothetical protein BroJett011_22580 [Chloroflexota bacterium]|nr:MAG: hypothetical protein BroJett011_22580 [Chloroflexota bacterium]
MADLVYRRIRNNLMMKDTLRLSLLCLLLLFSIACTPLGDETKPRPADFSLQYHWSESALPPPYHYEYTLHLGPGSQGLIEFWPDYPNPGIPIWTETFELKAGDLEKLYTLLQAKGLLEAQERSSQGPPPGAPADGLQVTVQGRQISLPSYVAGEKEAEGIAEVYEAVKAQVPEPIWTKLMGQYEQYQQDFLAGRQPAGNTFTPTPTRTSVPTGTNEVIEIDGFEGVIFSAENAETTGVANQGETYWTPSPAGVLALEKQLGPYLQETAPQDYPGPLRGLSEYKRQYVGLLVNEQQFILVNFFCSAHGIA